MKVIFDGTPEEINRLLKKELCCKQSPSDNGLSEKSIDIWENASMINHLAKNIQNVIAENEDELFK